MLRLEALRSDERAEADGTLVRTPVALALAYDSGPAGVNPRLIYPVTSGVVLLAPAARDRTPWSDFIGRRLTVRGSWTAGALHDVDAAPAPPLPRTPASPSDGPREPVAHDGGYDPREVEAAEAPLREDGSLLWLWTSPSGRVLAVASDPERVAVALLPLFGSRMRVVASPWSRDVYNRIDAWRTLAERQGVLVAAGGSIGQDGLVRRDADVHHVTEELAAAARDIPDGPFTVRAMLQPLRASRGLPGAGAMR